jgi:hypothetical protein
MADRFFDEQAGVVELAVFGVVVLEDENLHRVVEGLGGVDASTLRLVHCSDCGVEVGAGFGEPDAEAMVVILFSVLCGDGCAGQRWVAGSPWDGAVKGSEADPAEGGFSPGASAPWTRLGRAKMPSEPRGVARAERRRGGSGDGGARRSGV